MEVVQVFEDMVDSWNSVI